MIRNKYILCFMFLLFAATSFAQSRYALSFSDYMDGKFTALENLTIESRSKSKRFWNGGADFKPETGNKETDKLLKKDVKYIIHQDTLYVNCRQLRYQGCKFGNWYAPGFRFGTGVKYLMNFSNRYASAYSGQLRGTLVSIGSAWQRNTANSNSSAELNITSAFSW